MVASTQRTQSIARIQPEEFPAGLMGDAAHLRYSTGETISDIAAAFNVAWEEAAHWLRDHGRFRDPRRVTLTPNQVADLESRALTLGSAAEVAEHLGLTVEDLALVLGRRKKRLTGPVDELAALSSQQVADIATRYTAGDTSVRLAAEFGVTQKTIGQALINQNVSLRDGDAALCGKQPLSDRQVQRILSRFREGIPSPIIAAEMSLQHSSVQDVLRDSGVLLPAVEAELARLTPERIQQIVDLSNERVFAVAIATQFGLLPQTVRMVVRDARHAARETRRNQVKNQKIAAKEARRNDSKPSGFFAEGSSRLTPALLHNQASSAPGAAAPVPMPQWSDQPTKTAPATVVPLFSASVPTEQVTPRPRTPGLPRMFSEDQADQIVARYQAGESAAALAIAFGVTGPTIATALDARGIERRRRIRGGSLTSDQEAEALAAYTDGASQRGLAARFGVGVAVIERLLDAHHEDRRSGHRVLADGQINSTVTRYQAGESARAIAADLGVSNDAVLRALESRGIPRRGHSDSQARALSDEDTDMVITFYRDGETIAELARTFGVNNSTITRLLKDRGVTGARPPRQPATGRSTAPQKRRATRRPADGTVRMPRMFDATQAEEISTRYQAGESLDSLAQAFRCSLGSVANALEAQGIPRRSPAQRKSVLTNAQIAEIVQRYQDGESTNELGRAYQVAASTVARTLDRLGVPLRPTGRLARTASGPRTPKKTGGQRGGKGQTRSQMHVLTAEEAKAVAVRYIDGASVLQIAQEFSVGKTTILATLKRQNVPRRSPGRQARLTASQVAVARARAAAGVSEAEIARGLGVSRLVVSTALTAPHPNASEEPVTDVPAVDRPQAAAVRTPAPPFTAKEIDDIAYEFVNRTPVEEIADLYDAPVEQVIDALITRGVPRNMIT